MFFLGLALLLIPVVGTAVWLKRKCCQQKIKCLPAYNTTNLHPHPVECLISEAVDPITNSKKYKSLPRHVPLPIYPPKTSNSMRTNLVPPRNPIPPPPIVPTTISPQPKTLNFIQTTSIPTTTNISPQEFGSIRVKDNTEFPGSHGSLHRRPKRRRPNRRSS